MKFELIRTNNEPMQIHEIHLTESEREEYVRALDEMGINYVETENGLMFEATIGEVIYGFHLVGMDDESVMENYRNAMAFHVLNEIVNKDLTESERDDLEMFFEDMDAVLAAYGEQNLDEAFITHVPWRSAVKVYPGIASAVRNTRNPLTGKKISGGDIKQFHLVGNALHDKEGKFVRPGGEVTTSWLKDIKKGGRTSRKGFSGKVFSFKKKVGRSAVSHDPETGKGYLQKAKEGEKFKNWNPSFPKYAGITLKDGGGVIVKISQSGKAEVIGRYTNGMVMLRELQKIK